MIVVDFYSIFSAGLIGSIGFYLAGTMEFVFRWAIAVMLVFPKTSSLKELKNKPIKRIKGTLDTAAGVDAVLAAVNKDPNLKIANATHEIERILRAIHSMKVDIVLSGMDYVVIHRYGIELLILELEKDSNDENYDRSIFVDITRVRSELFRYDMWGALIAALVAFYLTGDEQTRSYIRESILKAFFKME